MLSRIVRRGRHLLANLQAAITTTPTKQARFRCNICGNRCVVPTASLTREQPTCRYCGSSVRQRAVMHLLSLALFGRGLALPDFPARPDLVGIDMSGAANYADGLACKLGFTNTFLHKPPRLDIADPDPYWFERCDFVPLLNFEWVKLHFRQHMRHDSVFGLN